MAFGLTNKQKALITGGGRSKAPPAPPPPPRRSYGTAPQAHVGHVNPLGRPNQAVHAPAPHTGPIGLPHLLSAIVPHLALPQIAQSILGTTYKAPKVFHSEGPSLYHAAYQRNAPFATPGPYQTKLGPAQEQAFRQWAKTSGLSDATGYHPDQKHTDYDYRGFFKATGGKGWKPGKHFPDAFKTPLDTTFSAESKYAKPHAPMVWRGQNLVNKRTGATLFMPPNKKVALARRVASPRAQALLASLYTGSKPRPLPGLTPSEARTANIVLSTGVKKGATPKELLAATETGLVEGPRFESPDMAHSDSTSAGWRQETQQARYGPESRRIRPRPTARDFFGETAAKGRGAGVTSGQLAQSVQGSAYPARYDQVAAQAVPILQQFLRNRSSVNSKAVRGLRRAGVPVPKAARQALALGGGSATVPGKGRYAYPLGEGWTLGRTDEGLDATAAPGTPIRAIGRGRAIGPMQSGWPGSGPGLVYELARPVAGHKFIFIAENAAPTVRSGARIRKGQVVARSTSSAGIETGFASGPSGAPEAQPTYNEGDVTTQGKEFTNFVGALARGKTRIPYGLVAGGGGVYGLSSGSTAIIGAGSSPAAAAGNAQQVQRRSAAVDSGALATLYAGISSSAVLPADFMNFQTGTGGRTPSGPREKDIIGQILRRSRG